MCEKVLEARFLTRKDKDYQRLQKSTCPVCSPSYTNIHHELFLTPKENMVEPS